MRSGNDTLYVERDAKDEEVLGTVLLSTDKLIALGTREQIDLLIETISSDDV